MVLTSSGFLRQRGFLHVTRNEILTHHKRNSVYITSLGGRNEVKFRFGDAPRKTAHSVKDNRFWFDEINACAYVSFHIMLFWVVFTLYLITQNEILFLSK